MKSGQRTKPTVDDGLVDLNRKIDFIVSILKRDMVKLGPAYITGLYDKMKAREESSNATPPKEQQSVTN